MQRSTMLVSMLIVVASSVQPVQAGRGDNRLDIYWIDVEGGAATLLVTPAGESVLIDTGNPGNRDPDQITNSGKDSQANFIKLSVDSSGASYKEQVPSTGHERTCRTR